MSAKGDGGDGGDGVLNWMLSGVIGERVRLTSIGSFASVGGGGGTLRGGEIEVALVDGFFEGASGALGDETSTSVGVIDQVAARSGMNSKLAKTCYHSQLLPPKKRIHSPSSSSTTLSNSSRNQTCDLVSPSSSVYTPTPPQIFEIGKCPIKMYLKHHEGQIEDILNYLDELYLHHIEKMEEGRINRMIIRRDGNKLKTELERICTQIIKLQKKKLGQKDKIAFAHYRISNLEQIIKDDTDRHHNTGPVERRPIDGNGSDGLSG
ncbi:hypothetical protein Tco_0947538, partial [Tanacetum coccineum]